MLIIRHAQLQLLAQAPRERFIDDMLVHLYRYFPTVSWLLTPEELRAQVDAVIRRAAVYQLRSPQQVCRFLNLAAVHGWEFDRAPDAGWMRGILTDSSLAEPGERLDRLVQGCLHRQEVEAHNLALRQQTGLAAAAGSSDASADEPDESEDYAGHDLYPNTQTAAASTEELFAHNPLAYHLSQSLWHGPEAAVPARPNPVGPAWVSDGASLLRQKAGGRHVADR